MFMPRQNEVGVRRVKVFPELLQFRMQRVALEDSAAEQRMVTISEYASVGVLREILLQPGVLRRACVTAPQAPDAAGHLVEGGSREARQRLHTRLWSPCAVQQRSPQEPRAASQPEAVLGRPLRGARRPHSGGA